MTLRSWQYRHCVLRVIVQSASSPRAHCSLYRLLLCLGLLLLCPQAEQDLGLPAVTPGTGQSAGAPAGVLGACSGFPDCCWLLPAEHPPCSIGDSAAVTRAFAFKDHAAASVQLFICNKIFQYQLTINASKWLFETWGSLMVKSL